MLDITLYCRDVYAPSCCQPVQVIIYEITRLKTRHARLREVLLPAQAQSLDVFSEGRLCVGYQSGFTIYSLLGDQHPLSLVHPDNQMLGFLAYSPVDALGAIELPRGEFLLVFNTLGVYVDLQVMSQSSDRMGSND